VALVDPIKIDGLQQFSRDLRKLGADLPKALRLAGNEGAQLVVDWARPRVPGRSGAARRSIVARSTRTESRVIGGSTRVPYYPWLDFGGRVGPGRSVKRTFMSGGRFIYPGYAARRDEVEATLVTALLNAAQAADLDVTP